MWSTARILLTYRYKILTRSSVRRLGWSEGQCQILRSAFITARQFVIGLGLGIIWSPCVGSTLGAATTLASQGRDLTQIALLMMIFALDGGMGSGSFCGK